MKYIESWWVEELPNGVFHLLINTTERWIYFSRSTDIEFYIGNEPDTINVEEYKNNILTIPEFLPKNNKIYICAEMQEKDQISFYWIPFSKDYIKTKKIILSSDERENN